MHGRVSSTAGPTSPTREAENPRIPELAVASGVRSSNHVEGAGDRSAAGLVRVVAVRKGAGENRGEVTVRVASPWPGAHAPGWDRRRIGGKPIQWSRCSCRRGSVRREATPSTARTRSGCVGAAPRRNSPPPSRKAGPGSSRRPTRGPPAGPSPCRWNPGSWDQRRKSAHVVWPGSRAT